MSDEQNALSWLHNFQPVSVLDGRNTPLEKSSTTQLGCLDRGYETHAEGMARFFSSKLLVICLLSHAINVFGQTLIAKNERVCMGKEKA